MKRYGERVIFDNGFEAWPNGGIIGLKIHDDEKGFRISEGFDSLLIHTSCMEEYQKDEMNLENSLEMCDYMIGEWKKCKKIALRKIKENKHENS